MQTQQHDVTTGVNGKDTIVRPLLTDFYIFYALFSFFLYLSYFPIKMLATDTKTQKIEPYPHFFCDGRKFRRQRVNVLDITWGHVYFLTCKYFRWEFQTQSANTFRVCVQTKCRILPFDSLWEHIQTQEEYTSLCPVSTLFRFRSYK